jgi:hypothetical protein
MRGMTIAYLTYVLKGKLPAGVCLTIIGTEGLGSADRSLIVDCDSRQVALVEGMAVVEGATAGRAKNDAPRPMIEGIENKQFMSPAPGMNARFVQAVCEGELLGVETSPASSGWKHFVEGPGRAVYFIPGRVKKVGKYQVASVRLDELEAAQTPDGQRFDGRNAVWVIDCEQKLGAVAYEQAFSKADGKYINIIGLTMGSEKVFQDPSTVDLSSLKFGRPVPGSSQFRFGEAACALSKID